MISKPKLFYKPCYTSKPFVYGVEGPGNGIGYYAWLGCPQNTFATWEEAEKAARMMDMAFREGMAFRSRQITELLK